MPDDSKELEVANNLGIKTKSWEDIPESIYLKRWTQLKMVHLINQLKCKMQTGRSLSLQTNQVEK